MTKAPVECIFGGPRIKESDVTDATHARHEPPGKRAERTCMATYNETTREAQEKFLLSTLHDDEPRARKVTSNGRCGRWVELGTEPVKKKKCLCLLPFIKLFILFFGKYFFTEPPRSQERAISPAVLQFFACCLRCEIRTTRYYPHQALKGGYFSFLWRVG